jgi:hypothetical protein
MPLSMPRKQRLLALPMLKTGERLASQLTLMELHLCQLCDFEKFCIGKCACRTRVQPE